MTTITLLQKPRVQVYVAKPPDHHGYKASCWGACVAICQIRLTTMKKKAEDRVEGQDHRAKEVQILLFAENELYAECRVVDEGPLERYVEPTYDSSRGFVLRLVCAADKRRRWLGVLFEEQDDAYDFHYTLTINLRKISADTSKAEEIACQMPGQWHISSVGNSDETSRFAGGRTDEFNCEGVEKAEVSDFITKTLFSALPNPPRKRK